jgi:hypothetical protein
MSEVPTEQAADEDEAGLVIPDEVEPEPYPGAGGPQDDGKD